MCVPTVFSQRKEEKGNERKGKLLLRETIKLQYVLPTVKYCNELVTRKKKKKNRMHYLSLAHSVNFAGGLKFGTYLLT